MEIKRKELISALDKVKPGLASQEIIEQSTSFVFKNGYVATYNDEIAVSYPLDIGMDGAAHNKEILSLLGKIKDEELTLEKKQGELIIIGKKFKSGIRIEKEINLPLDFLDTEVEYRDLPEDFIEGANLCVFSAAKEKVSSILSNIHVKDNFIESCDNFRLTRFKLKEEIEDELLISAKGVRHLTDYSLNQYGLTEGWIHFKDKENGLTFSCRTFEENYPDLDNFLLAKGSPIRLPDGLIEMLDRSSIFSSGNEGKDNLVSINIGNNWCAVRGENENGWFEEKTRIKIKDKEYAFMASPKILKDILKKTQKAILTESILKFRSNKFDHVMSLTKKKEK